MDIQLVCIALIFLLLMVFDKIDNKEHFTIKIDDNKYPISQQCTSCNLNEDIMLNTNEPSINKLVHTNCKNTYNYNPKLVSGKSAGRTRKCRILF